MKKFLIAFGAFLLFLITAGTLFKLMHWPGAGPLLVIGMFLFACFFLPLFFFERIMGDKRSLNIVTSVFGMLSGSSLFMGVLFKVMHWPGAGPLILFGAFLFICPTLILYVLQQFRDYDRRFSEFWRLVVMAVLTCIFLIFWGTNVSRNVLTGFLTIEDKVLNVNENLKQYNIHLLTEIKIKDGSGVHYSSAERINKLSLENYQYVQDLKDELVKRVDGNPASIENHWNIPGKDNYDISTHFLGASYSTAGDELWTSLNRYSKTLQEEMRSLKLRNVTKEEIEGLKIETEPRDELLEEYELSWNQAMFQHQTVVATLAILSGIQTEILDSEFKALQMLLKD